MTNLYPKPCFITVERFKMLENKRFFGVVGGHYHQKLKMFTTNYYSKALMRQQFNSMRSAANVGNF